MQKKAELDRMSVSLLMGMVSVRVRMLSNIKITPNLYLKPQNSIFKNSFITIFSD